MVIKKGLEKIKEIKSRVQEVEVRVEDRNFQDLVNIFNLDSALITGEATIISALNRKESRSAHQRSDYKDTNINQEVNYKIYLKNNKLEIEKSNLNKLNGRLAELVENIKKIDASKDKLLE